MSPSLPFRVPNRMRGICLIWAGLLFGLAAAGCTRQVKAEFPRPPATAGIPPTEEAQPASEPSVDVAGREPGEDVPIPEPPPEVEEPEPVSREPAPPPVAAEPSDEPEPEPLSTQLAGADEAGSDPDIIAKLEQAGALLGMVGGRELSQGQREQIAAARGFVAQARRALDEGDERRALVLVDKGLLLAEDVERTSRP